MTDSLIDALRGQVARSRAQRVLARNVTPLPTYKARKLAVARVRQVEAAHQAIAERFNSLRLLAAVPVGCMQ